MRQVSPAGVVTDTNAASLLAAQATLGASFSITGAAGVYQDTGLSVTLPAAGTYLLFADVRVSMQLATGTFGYIEAKLYNSTDAADVANSETVVLRIPSTGARYDSTAPIVVVVTVAAAKTVKLYAMRDTDGTWTTSNVSSASSGRTRLSYLKVG